MNPARNTERVASMERVQEYVRQQEQLKENDPDREIKKACTVCIEEFLVHDLYQLDCLHNHCADCIKASAQLAMESAPFVPAKCCQVITRDFLAKAGAFSDEEEMDRYFHKMEEITSPESNLYCHDKHCNAYIPAEKRTQRIGECAKCQKKTCKDCRLKSHFGACDPANLKKERQSEDVLFKLAKKKGWKRCPNCLHIVQKAGGCSHVTCQCGQSFCYACGEPIGNAGHRCPVTGTDFLDIADEDWNWIHPPEGDEDAEVEGGGVSE
ncbi:hypothetical protein F4677DRAFT_442463 [Hypoxylon crocopeplum]|nr:hypothetical protein F4677DRAFT_442463 [Hypoxylon crocopeplum]